MKKRKIIISIIVILFVCGLTISIILYGNKDENKMAVFESREQFVEWLVAGDYGAAPSRFHSSFGGHPDIEADVSYLVPLIKEYGIPTFTCDDGELSYSGGYITLSPYARSGSGRLNPQLLYHLTLNGYEYTVYATYITEGVRDLIENFDKYEAEKEDTAGLKMFLKLYLGFSFQNVITVEGVDHIYSEEKDYNFAYKSDETGMLETDYLQWGFISENFMYYISFDAGKNKENYDAVTALIPKIKPVVISYEELVGSGVE